MLFLENICSASYNTSNLKRRGSFGAAFYPQTEFRRYEMRPKKPGNNLLFHRAPEFKASLGQQPQRRALPCAQGKLYDIVEALYKAGIRHFICGMALGCDIVLLRGGFTTSGGGADEALGKARAQPL